MSPLARCFLPAVISLSVLLFGAVEASAVKVKIEDGTGQNPLFSDGKSRGYFYADVGGAQNTLGWCSYNAVRPGWYFLMVPDLGESGAEDPEDCPTAADTTITVGATPDGVPPEGVPPEGVPPEGPPVPPSTAVGRACKTSTGANASCYDDVPGGPLSGEAGTGYVVVSTDEFGVCNYNPAFPAQGDEGGTGYYYGHGPNNPDGSAGGDDCPSAAPAAPAPGTPPPSGGGGGGNGDSDNDGRPDAHDACPTTAGAGADGCPTNTAPGGGSDTGGSDSGGSDTGGSKTGGSKTGGSKAEGEKTSPRRDSDTPPSGSPRVDVTRDEVPASPKSNSASVPVKCKSRRGACRGSVALTTTVRTKSGRRRTVQVGSASFRIRAGKTAKVVVKLTAAGRRLLKNADRVRATATMTVKTPPRRRGGRPGRRVERETVVLRRS